MVESSKESGIRHQRVWCLSLVPHILSNISSPWSPMEEQIRWQLPEKGSCHLQSVRGHDDYNWSFPGHRAPKSSFPACSCYASWLTSVFFLVHTASVAYVTVRVGGLADRKLFCPVAGAPWRWPREPGFITVQQAAMWWTLYPLGSELQQVSIG